MRLAELHLMLVVFSMPLHALQSISLPVGTLGPEFKSVRAVTLEPWSSTRTNELCSSLTGVRCNAALSGVPEMDQVNTSIPANSSPWAPIRRSSSIITTGSGTS